MKSQMTSLKLILIPVLFLLFSITSCKKEENPGENEIWMIDNQFQPKEKKVSAGTTITWTNKDNFNHTVTDASGNRFDETVAGGGTYSFTFDTVGTYPINCTIHAGMDGTVIVE